VGCYNSSGNFSYFSNYGVCVDVEAPGENVPGAALNKSYTTGSGTSFSCPVVAGAALLFLSANPTATCAQTLKALQDASHVPLVTSPYVKNVPANTNRRSIYVASL
jgi:subtilisin family serine protease